MKNLREIFNPNKITLSGKATIVDTSTGKYVIKEHDKDLESLFNYLDNRSFTNHPKIIDKIDNNYVYEYVDENKTPINQKASDMASLLASLHYKTAYFTNIEKDNIKEIYENILDNILYFENYYNNLFNEIEKEEYMRPSYYLLIKNRAKVSSLIGFLKENIEKWYQDMINNDKVRVVYNHNNLSINHYRNNNFISWDNYKIDSPILDLINVYHNDFNKYDYETFLNKYLKEFSLTKEEKRLFFTVISIPKTTYFTDNEMDNTIMIGKFIDYINNTERLIRPHYPID